MLTTTTTTLMSSDRADIISAYKLRLGDNFIQSTTINGKLVIDFKAPDGHYIRRTFITDDGSFTTSKHYQYWSESDSCPYGEISAK
jgi:hypothetical protein